MCAGVNGFAGLRIALVGPLPPPAGGMANQTRQLAQLLRIAHAQVELVQTNAPYRPAWMGRVPMLRAAARLLPYAVRLWQAAGRNDVFHVMANSGWSWHLFATPAIRIAARRGVPVVVNYRGGEAAAFLARSHRSVRATMERASAVAVPSAFLHKVFDEYGIGSEVVPNVVDLQRFRPGSAERPRGAHLVVTRNLEPIYDNATAIRALAILRRKRTDARLTIAGTGPQRAALQALISELHLDDVVHLAGRLERDEVAALYREADVVLNPSTVDNAPNSLLEAMASGVPIVSTDVGGVPYLVQHGRTAWLVAPRDADAMADAVLRLLCDRAQADAMICAGLEEVRRYTWEQVSQMLAQLYARVTVAPSLQQRPDPNHA